MLTAAGLVCLIIWLVLNVRQAVSLWWLWSVLMFLSLVGLFHGSFFGFIIFIALAASGAIMGRPEWRKKWLSLPLFSLMKRGMPPISDTESTALKAGDLWWDKEIFSGQPDWSVLAQVPSYELTEKEQHFFDNEVNTLCSMVDAYQVRQNQDLPEEVWAYIKEHKFLGLVIPESYGGLGFSHSAHARIVTRLASRSSALGVTVMVPNSLGPGELLVKYGTQAQKDTYLPRLSAGKDIPCFALTSTVAGSDANSIEDVGIVCEKTIKGKKTLGFKLNWEKRYITLSPVATLLGLAFKAYDPDGLLQSNGSAGQVDLGITCAMIPTSTKGVTIGKRHNPLGTAFMNGPNQGKDVFIPMDYIIGGEEMIGQGWRMLMECLSIGRSISLPASGGAGCQMSVLTSGAYTHAREQFGLPIALFEGVGEKLSHLVIHAYRTKANSFLTTSALDANIKPAIISALIKYRNTEMARQSVLHTQDVHGGRAIICGPKNYCTDAFLSFPFGITVEGANILSRTLMAFGQGVTRCHPFVHQEMDALHNEDQALGQDDFDAILPKHMAFSVKNFLRLPLLLMRVPPMEHGNKKIQKYYKNISIACQQFATLADLSLLLLRGELKRKEMISGQFADSLAAIYEATAAVRYFESMKEADGKIEFVMQASVTSLLAEHEQALRKVISNLPLRWPLKSLVTVPIFGLWVYNKPLSDEQRRQLAKLTSDIDWMKQHLLMEAYISEDSQDPVQEMIIACKANQDLKDIKRKVKDHGAKYEPNESFEAFTDGLVAEHVLSQAEADQWKSTREIIFKAMSVNEFEPDGLEHI